MRATVFLCALLSLASIVATSASAQRPRHVDTRELAMRFISGRYLSPISCTRADGTIFEAVEAMTIRRDRAHAGGGNTLRATFYGIDVTDAAHCQTLLQGRLPDRRGNLYFSFLPQTRQELGIAYFRTLLKRGDLVYHVQDGKLTTRSIGSDATPGSVVDYGGKNAELSVKLLDPLSDAYRVLSMLAEKRSYDFAGRRLEFRVTSPEGGSFTGYYLEDMRADADGRVRRTGQPQR